MYTMLRALFVMKSSTDTDKISEAIERENNRLQVTTVHSPEQAIELISDRPPDCIVSEYKFPNGNGIELLQVVRDTHPFLPFILFLSSGTESVASDAISAGVTDYIPRESGDNQTEQLCKRIVEAVDESEAEWEQNQRTSKIEDKLTLFQRVQDIADIGGWSYNVQTGEATLSKQVYDIYGLSEDDPISVENTLNCFHEEDQSAIRDAFERACTDGESYDLTLRLRSTTDTQRWVRVRGDPQVRDETVVSVQGTIQDVTEQTNRQRELRLLQQAIDDANIAITLADPAQDDEPLVYVNDAFTQLTGYTPAETIGRNCRFLQGKDTDPAKVDSLREAIDNEESVTVELRNYRKDGTEFWNRLTLTPIYSDEGQLVRYLGTQKDITTQRRRQKELTDERRFITRALNTLDDLFYVLDEDGYFQQWNERVPEVTGYTNSELDDMHAADVFPENERDKVIKAISEVLQGQQPTIEAHLQTVDGQQIPFEFTGNRLPGKEDNTTKVIGIGRDVSGRNERQRQLDVLDRVLRHNLRNEINVIRGHAEVIDENAANGVEQSIKKILRKSNDIIETANKSRKITKIAQQRPKSENKNISSLLNGVIQNISQNHPEAAVEFECHSEVEVNVSIHFEKALSELITNAIVHNDSSSPSVVVTVSLTDDMAQIKIADDGPQIPEVERQVLLQEDEQTPLYHGSGLGLSLVRLVISRSGGTVFYPDSSSGGNSIVIEVPKC